MKTPGHLISITIKRSLLFPFKRTWLKSIILTVLEQENVAGLMEIGCVITDDENIRSYNRRYRGIDEPTDVLSFTFTGESISGSDVDFPSVPGASCEFGDIMISYPRAVEQAEHLGHSVEEELTLLLVHGTLHLLNYDHQTVNEAKNMGKKEKIIIRKINEAAEKK